MFWVWMNTVFLYHTNFLFEVTGTILPKKQIIVVAINRTPNSDAFCFVNALESFFVSLYGNSSSCTMI